MTILSGGVLGYFVFPFKLSLFVYQFEFPYMYSFWRGGVVLSWWRGVTGFDVQSHNSCI